MAACWPFLFPGAAMRLFYWSEMKASFDAIIPDPFNPNVFVEEWEDAMRELIDDADRLFGSTYATWTHDPGFEKEVKVTARAIEGSTTTADLPYKFVTRGTAVRYATMTPDFVAKTRPRNIGSGAGRGGVAYISRRIPRPGIEARQFEEVIKDQMEPRFQKELQRATNDAAKKSNHQL